MCDATTALLVVNVASAGLKYKSQKAQQEHAYNAQKRQNELAKTNAIRRYASEQLRIRQELSKAAKKDYEGSLKSRKIRATFISQAGDAGGLALSGSTNRLLADYYRTEGKFRNAIRNNMAINISQFERNLEAIQFGQEAQSTYVTPPNPHLLFATQALNVANAYYTLEAKKQMSGLMSSSDKKNQWASIDDVR